jgi:gas vesicle protein
LDLDPRAGHEQPDLGRSVVNALRSPKVARFRVDSNMAANDQKAEIERLQTELREARARISELVRQNVEDSNRRENEIQKEIKQYCARWRESKDLIIRLVNALKCYNSDHLQDGLIDEARKAVVETRLREIF